LRINHLDSYMPKKFGIIINFGFYHASFPGLFGDLL
jgi:hypothetical protein